MRSHYYWPKMCSDIHIHCRNCAICTAQSAHGFQADLELLSEFLPKEPWACVNMDILNIGQPTRKGNRYVLAIIDKLTHFCILRAMPNQEAEIILKEFISATLILGFLCHIFMDRMTHFMSKLSIELTKTFGMTHMYTSKFNPQSNGQTENLNRVVLAMLVMICQSPNVGYWDEQLPYMQVAHNCTTHTVTGMKLCIHTSVWMNLE